MDDTKIYSSLVSILKEQTGIRGDVTPDTALLAESRIDSMDFMNYLLCIENQYGITIPDTDVEAHKLGVLKNMVEYIKTHRK